MTELRVLSDSDVEKLLDLDTLLGVVEDALVKQHRGAIERPDRPHFPVGTSLDPETPDEPLGTGLVMPAYIHGAAYYATKLVGVFEGNADRGLPTVNATVALTDAETGLPRGTSPEPGSPTPVRGVSAASPPVNSRFVGTRSIWA